MLSTRNNPHTNPWLTRLTTLLLSALAATSASYWVLKWPAPTSPRSAPVLTPGARPVDSAKVAKLLGASAAATDNTAPAIDLQAKYKLQGVIAAGTHSGSALIAIDGQPAKPYRVGEHLADDLLLQSVQARSATLAAGMQSAGTLTLELPLLPSLP